MLMIATLLIMLGCGYAQYRNGLFSSFAMLIMVFVSGIVAFGFFEPIADLLDPLFQNNMLAGCEDMIALIVLFTVTLFALRLATNYISPELLDEHGALQHFGGAGVGVVTGYFLAGFLLCTMQTLPIEENFLGFEPRASGEPIYRSVYPSDRVWLAMMRHAGAGPLSWKDDPTFDRDATFELRYLRYRRAQMPYFKEFDRELGKKEP